MTISLFRILSEEIGLRNAVFHLMLRAVFLLGHAIMPLCRLAKLVEKAGVLCVLRNTEVRYLLVIVQDI